jgi:lipid A ethanolaminephosphotransferase
MGETARADRFSLNGFERETNAFTRAHEIVNFSHVSACGTSTADSLPCIFSQFGRTDFSHSAFARNETLLQLFGRFGVDVRWLDNSTGCKHICDADTFVSVAGETDPGLCHDNVCVDEILLENFASGIAGAARDRFIVLHQRGSHGPAYYTDTPEWAKAYLPECDLPSLRNCDLEQINNAYDNTIRYTDYFLAQVIELLKAESDRYATAMLYVSDHGESLGEKGLYLHGLPYSIAPAEQTRVPMLFWASNSFYSSQALDYSCLLQRSAEPLTHDAVFHTLLPVFGIEAEAYDERLDAFAACRQRDRSVTPAVSAAA